MPNGLNINVKQDEFMKKSEPERSWMLFAGISQINNEGCSWSKTHYKKERYSMLKIVGASFGAALGTAIGLWKWVIK